MIRKNGSVVSKTLDNLATLRPELISSVAGVGYAHAVTFHNKGVSDKIQANCIEVGLLLVNTHKPTIKFAPPLTMPLNWFLKGISIFEEVVMNYEG